MPEDLTYSHSDSLLDMMREFANQLDIEAANDIEISSTDLQFMLKAFFELDNALSTGQPFPFEWVCGIGSDVPGLGAE